MNVTGISRTAAGLSVLKSAIRQPELALELLSRTVAAMPKPELPAQTVEAPASSGKGTIIDMQA